MIQDLRGHIERRAGEGGRSIAGIVRGVEAGAKIH